MSKQLDVFISSTCFDLLDLRAELTAFLREQGFLVRASDESESDFAVDPKRDSIESCLQNVNACDAVVCVIDRRYGPPLPTGEYEGKSATHAEISRARDLRKDVFFFMRDRAANEFDLMRSTDVYTGYRWVENGKNCKAWYEFVNWVAGLPKHQGWSNWYDPFSDVVDLKRIVYKRLIEQYPVQAASSLALRPGRNVRITFIRERDGYPSQLSVVRCYVKNVGHGPALDLVYGLRPYDVGEPLHEARLGGLAEGESGGARYGVPFAFEATKGDEFVIYCRYSNHYGDTYCVEQRCTWKGKGWHTVGPERQLVKVDDENWIVVSPRE